MFIGRERELATLNKLYASDKFEFVVIYGRRRVGKTALITQFIEDKNAIYFMGVESNAKQNLENFSKSILLAGGMGLRRSEALGIRWSRIDWEKKTVLLDTKIVEYKENGKVIVRPEEEMKNKSSRRTLPLPDPVYEMLTEEKEKQDMYRRLFKGSYNRKYDDFVCVNELGELIRPSYVTQHFSDLLKKYGLRHIRFHDLRHTFASLLISQNVPLINVSNFLGHSDLATTSNIYAHLDKASKQASADIMTDILNMGKE